MGLIDFIKGAGAKLFKKEPSAEEKADKKIDAEAKASDALENLVRKMQIPIDGLNVVYRNETATISGTADTQPIAEKAVLTVGNVNGVSRVNNLINVVNTAPEADYYTVQKGDWLSKIAKAHYGDAQKYKEIFEANKPMLSDPDKIYPGQVLRMPKL